ncbi:MAG: hypothetical protein EOO40_04830, partial [Deltaproteobacteria bacterium]
MRSHRRHFLLESRAMRPAYTALLVAALVSNALACKRLARTPAQAPQNSPCYNIAAFRDHVLRQATDAQRAKLSKWLPPQPVPRALRA